MSGYDELISQIISHPKFDPARDLPFEAILRRAVFQHLPALAPKFEDLLKSHRCAIYDPDKKVITIYCHTDEEALAAIKNHAEVVAVEIMDASGWDGDHPATDFVINSVNGKKKKSGNAFDDGLWEDRVIAAVKWYLKNHPGTRVFALDIAYYA